MDESEEKKKIGKAWKAMALLWSAWGFGLTLTYWQEPLLLTLASAFRFQLSIGFSLLTIPMLFFPHPRKWVLALFPLAIGMTFLGYLWPLSHGETTPQLTLVTTNVLGSNPDISRLKAWVQEVQPQIVGVVEVREHHRQTLEAMGYEYTTLYPHPGNFGLALLSRTPPKSVRLLDEESPFPSLLAEWPEYKVLLTHPIPPISAEARLIGDQQVLRIVEELKKSQVPVIAMGDFNATGWDMRLRPLLEFGLKDSRKGHGIIPTWPSDMSLAQIPIDHILIPKTWTSLECARGPDIGSDHFPLMTRILINP